MSDLGNKAIMAENIKYYMEKKNKTRNEICDDLGIKYTTFSDWVNGKKYPRIDKIEMLANYFGIEKSDLVEKRNTIPADAIPYEPVPTVLIPLVGAVNCGSPIFAEDNIEDHIPTPAADVLTGETYFWLKAKGDSMINVGIHDGDFLFIRQQSDVDSGDIAVVAINRDDATLKRVIKNEISLVLQPENPAYETKIYVGSEVDNICLRGRLMKVEKRFYKQKIPLPCDRGKEEL